MKFCEYLKELRLSAGYTPQEIADVLQIDRSTYAYYEAGKTEPSLQKLKRIANLYGLTSDDLIECRLRPVPFRLTSSERGDFSAMQALRRLSGDEQKLVLLYRSCTDKAEFLRTVTDFQNTEDAHDQ